MPPQPPQIPNTPPQPNVPPVPVPLTPEKIAENSYRFCKSKAYKHLSVDVGAFKTGTLPQADLLTKFDTFIRSQSSTQLQDLGMSMPPENDKIKKLFLNHFLYQIRADDDIKMNVENTMIESVVKHLHGEFHNIDQSDTELRNKLRELNKNRGNQLGILLGDKKKRRKFVEQYLQTKNTAIILKGYDFSDIERCIQAQLDLPVVPGSQEEKDRKKIIESWMTIMSLKNTGESLAQAFHRIHSGNKSDAVLIGSWKLFFSDKNTFITGVQRENILEFLTEEYLPTIPDYILRCVCPHEVRDRIVPGATFDIDTIDEVVTDEEASIIRDLRREKYAQLGSQYLTHSNSEISTKFLSREAKIALLSEFGMAGSAEKREKMMTDYIKNYGTPEDNLHKKTNETGDPAENYKTKFVKKYKDDVQEVDIEDHSVYERFTQVPFLAERLSEYFGDTISGIEHFARKNKSDNHEGCVMEWTKKKGNTVVTEYYIFDQEDDSADDDIIEMRYIGNNLHPLERLGVNRCMNGHDFFHTLAQQKKSTESIVFRTEVDFDNELRTNATTEAGPKYLVTDDLKKVLKEKLDNDTDIPTLDTLSVLSAKIEKVMYPHGDIQADPEKGEKNLDIPSPEHRGLRNNMIFVGNFGGILETLQISSIDENNKTITVWNGTSLSDDDYSTLSFEEFYVMIRDMKEMSQAMFRLDDKNNIQDPISLFNDVFANSPLNENHPSKRSFKGMSIQKIQGKNKLCFNPSSNQSDHKEYPIIKISGEKDLYIKDVSDEGIVTLRQGKYEDISEGKKESKFTGSGNIQIHLSYFWSFLQNRPNFRLVKPSELKVDEKKKSSSMSLLDIAKHAFDLGVLLKGDIIKIPWEKYQEQRKKDQNYAAQMTTGLLMEKYGWGELRDLVTSQSNAAAKSYIKELVDSIDSSTSEYRGKLIKRWSTKFSFPHPRFIAAMFASMKIFGHLYPNAKEGDYHYKNHGNQWFWYNNIQHHLGGKPRTMPQDNWPKQLIKPNGDHMTEMEACHKMFGSYRHPVMTNLYKLFTTYESGSLGELLKAKGNLEDRVTEEEKAEWMMETVMTGKIPELFGEVTESWIGEGYSKCTTTKPYAALMFSGRCNDLSSGARTHIKGEFQGGYQIPMLGCLSSPNESQKFNAAAQVFADSISSDCGDTLKELIQRARKPRLAGEQAKQWGKDLSAFWDDYGDRLMDKLTGMNDPTLMMIANDVDGVFDSVVDNIPNNNQYTKSQYTVLKAKKDIIKDYYSVIKHKFDESSKATTIPRDKGFYGGDHFRYKRGFSMAGFNWGTYLDNNLDDKFAQGDGLGSGDGIYGEIKKFFYDLPNIAKKIAVDMGYKSTDRATIDKIANAIYKKNVEDEGFQHYMKKIKMENKKASYCSIDAAMLGFISIVKIGTSLTTDDVRNSDWEKKMKETMRKAQSMEAPTSSDGFCEAMKYREEMAKKFKYIVEKDIPTHKTDTLPALSIEEIENCTMAYLTQRSQGITGNDVSEKVDTILRPRSEVGAEMRHDLPISA